MDTFSDSSATSRASPFAGPSSGMVWTHNGPMLKMEDAVVETVVTHTTRTTTSFAPIPLPRITPPESITSPDHLSPEEFPLSHEPTPEDMRFFALSLGGKRVLIHEDGTVAPLNDQAGVTRGAGWVRRFATNPQKEPPERMAFMQALNRAKGKEVRKRPHEGQLKEIVEVPVTDSPIRQRSPPRKKVRGMEDLSISHDHLLSPLPSPDHEGPREVAPSVGSGTEVAALMSLPAMIAHFDSLPDKLQSYVLMHLFRRARMPTIQRLSAFASNALKRDFIAALPHELAVQVLRRVDVKGLASAARVSKKWNKMVDSEKSVWRQRLIDDGFWRGLGVDEEEETLIQRRYQILDTIETEKRHRAGTPEDDDIPMTTAASSRPAALKHVYRRRHTASKRWLTTRPVHNSFPGHGTNVVTCLQFDRDKIVSASDDHSINVYDTATGQLRKRLDGHEGGVWALEYKGDTLVSGSTDRTVRVWDLESLCEAHIFWGHTSTVRCLQIVEPVFDPETGEYQPPYPMIVTGSRDASLRVWKLPKKGEPAYRRQANSSSTDNQVPPDENPFHLHHLEGHTQAVRALAAHGRICVSGSYDSTVRVWDIVKGTCIHVLTGHGSKVYSIVYDRLRKRCASGSMDNTVKVWDIVTGQCIYTLTGHTSLVGLLGLSPNYLVSAAADASLRIWDANTHQLKHVLSSHSGAITCFQHDETKVISGSDGTLKLWDIKTGQYIRDLVIGISSVWQIAFNGNLLVAASNRQGNTVFDVFDFGYGGSTHPSGVDDDSLDSYLRLPWERDNPREPHTYQGDDMDGVESSRAKSIETDSQASPILPSDGKSASARSARIRQFQRRSTRIASRPKTSRGEGSDPVSFYPGAGGGGGGHRRHRGEATSPSPAGPSGSSSTAAAAAAQLTGQSFAPDFDDTGDEPMED